MSMRDIMARLREEDPDFARSIQRLRVFSIGIAAVAFLALLFAVASNLVNFGQANDITNVTQHVTKIEHSACQRSSEHPHNMKAARECAEIRAHIARSEPIENPCISYQRVSGRKGQNCRRFYVDTALGGHPEGIGAPPIAATSEHAGTPAGGGDAELTGNPGHSQPGPHEGGSTETGTTQGGSPGASSHSDSTTTIVTPESEPAGEAAPPKEPVREALGTVTAPVGGTVESVTGKTCEATGLLCSK